MVAKKSHKSLLFSPWRTGSFRTVIILSFQHFQSDFWYAHHEIWILVCSNIRLNTKDKLQTDGVFGAFSFTFSHKLEITMYWKSTPTHRMQNGTITKSETAATVDGTDIYGCYRTTFGGACCATNKILWCYSIAMLWPVACYLISNGE